MKFSGRWVLLRYYERAANNENVNSWEDCNASSTRLVLLCCPVGICRRGQRARLDEIEMGTERRDRRRQLHDTRTCRESRSAREDRQDLCARIPRDSTMPAYPPRAFKITVVQPGQAGSPASDPARRLTTTTSSKAGSASAASSTASAISAWNTSTTMATSSSNLPIPPD